MIMLAGVRGWWSQSSKWGGQVQAAEGRRDRLMPGQRAGEVFAAGISLLVLVFFFENQARGTGFFTSRFGLTEQALFYGSALVGVTVSLARAAYGRRNAVRPLDTLYGALLVVTALTLLRVFPFDFAHFPDLMPKTVRFAFFWLSNSIGAVGLVFVAIGGFASMLYNAVVFAASRPSRAS